MKKKMGILLSSNATKLKCLEKIDQMYRLQERVLTQTTEGFIFKQAVRELRDGRVLFGAPRTHRAVVSSSQWPVFETFKTTDLEKFEQESLLRDIKITKIEWTCLDTICTLRFGFSNGTMSVQLGNRLAVKESFVVPVDVEIRKVTVSVRGEQEYLEAINFYDQNEELILGIRGQSVKGTWATMQLEKD